MLYVMRMSTDQDIINTKLSKRWETSNGDYDWDQIKGGNLQIPQGSTIIVIAHGNNDEIGNKRPGEVDIDGPNFVYLISNNMRNGSSPSNIYISTCGEQIAGFAAQVRLLAEENNIWKNTRIFGHSNSVSGYVPFSTEISWYEI
jgi:hypothetical protein